MDREVQEIFDQNLSPAEHSVAINELREKNKLIKKDKTHRNLRSANGSKNQQITMKPRTYDVLKLIKQIRGSQTVGTIFDDLTSPNRNKRDRALAFINDFCGKRLDDLFKYSTDTRTWEIDHAGIDAELFNRMDDHGYLDA